MQPQLTMNWLAMLVSVIACFVFGGTWYGPLFGKAWGTAMGFNMDQKPDPKVMKRAFALQILGSCLMVFVMAHVVQVWRPSVWNAGPDQPSCIYAVSAAVFTWLGFYVPLQLSKIAWENKPWKVFFINAGHDIIQLMFVAMILSYWR
jgi:hypothetical protein